MPYPRQLSWRQHISLHFTQSFFWFNKKLKIFNTETLSRYIDIFTYIYIWHNFSTEEIKR